MINIFLLLSASVIPDSSLSVGVGPGSSVVGAAVVSGSVELSIIEGESDKSCTTIYTPTNPK